MDSKILIQKIVKQIDFVENLYDYIRLVDPMQKKIYSYSKIASEKVIDINDKCYKFWGKSKACENCSSMRTLNYKKTIVKIEYDNAKVYLITSVPIEYEGTWLVVELIKDIMDDGIIVVEGQEVAVIRNMVDRNNSLVVRDAFTRIYNEKYIYDKLPQDILKAKKENRKMALLIISINNFKDINNLYGFKTGDEIIKEFSKKIKNYCRKDEDWAARYSGLEFVLVMFDVDEKQVYRICKRVNDKLNKSGVLVEGQNIKVDFSIGFQILESENLTTDELILAASKNLYTESEEPINNKARGNLEEILPKYLFTEREKEVAILLLKGHTNIEIAKILFVGLSTVKKHVANIFEKSNVKSRTEFISRIKMQI